MIFQGNIENTSGKRIVANRLLYSLLAVVLSVLLFPCNSFATHSKAIYAATPVIQPSTGDTLYYNITYNDLHIIKDHLDSPRKIFTNLTVRERNYYYPFGLRTDQRRAYPTFSDRYTVKVPRLNTNGLQTGYRSTAPYTLQYNGKELQQLANTTLIDYGARQYNPTLARWTAQDPMAEKYYGISPYAYCIGNPINMVDVNGEDIVLWLIMARILEKSSKNHKIKEIGYAIQHPTKAARVSSYKKGSYNISTIATNFQINAINSAGLDQWDEGDYGNAFRHTLWQGLIARDLGVRHAQRIGNAHEKNPFVDLSKKTFSDINEADQTADLLNNVMSNYYGTSNIPNRPNGAVIYNKNAVPLLELTRQAIQNILKK